MDGCDRFNCTAMGSCQSPDSCPRPAPAPTYHPHDYWGFLEYGPTRCAVASAAADEVLGPVSAPSRSTNPKRAQGIKKPPVHLVPDSGLIHVAMAFKDGAAKYGPYNWRDDPVDVSTYVAAAKRHLAAYFNGEQNASDSGVHHLAHAAACLFILMDAETSGTLIDDRPKAQDIGGLIASLTQKVSA